MAISHSLLPPSPTATIKRVSRSTLPSPCCNPPPQSTPPSLAHNRLQATEHYLDTRLAVARPREPDAVIATICTKASLH
ncbi:hypothetical protein E2C01_020647 [Portunus trituberculatus]|uniref:Uncharacterized protein n=1 Tax=Portunus trituberculatus TaxID=210409 RepID=A0A5B7E2B1_PORTR|nr:hypothetical protein [Portunus trituberculatus]